MKLIIAVFSTVLMVSFLAFQNTNTPATETAKTSTIRWCAGQELEWHDFKGKPDTRTNHQARTNYEVGFDVNIEHGKVAFVVTCNFVPNKSWVKKPAIGNDYLLRHEQLHFDLAEVYARKMRKQFAEANITIHNLKEKSNKIYETNWKALVKMQKEYDHDTQHSIIKAEQAKWDKKITRMLKENLEYQDKTNCRLSK